MNSRAFRKAVGMAPLLLILGSPSGPLPGGIPAQPGSRSLQSLVEAERSFSKLSEEKGLKEAFLTYLADDAIVFRPKPVPGRKVYEAAADNSPALLTWEPAYAEVALEGDLGYTTGPYQLRDRGKPGDPARHGHYVSLWQKQPSGLWRVVVDAGISHPHPGFRPVEVMTRKETGRSKRPARVDKFTELNLLLKVEADFSTKAASEGVAAAYRAFAHDDVRFYREGSPPTLGLDTLPPDGPGEPGRLTWEPMDGDVSRFGTLGFIFGTAEWRSRGEAAAPSVSSSFLRIWRKTPDGQWKIALDLAVPIPPE